MVYKPAVPMRESEVTPKEVFLNRRQIVAAAGIVAGAALAPGGAWAAALQTTQWSRQPDELTPTPKGYATSYNNFYEFGTGKDDPAKHAGRLTVSPWAVRIDGLVDKPGDYAYEDIVPAVVEERIYRFRCVEAWSMVVPWNGFELKTLLDRVGVQSSARYVAFETLVRPSEMPGQTGFFQPLAWPYREGLRLDEAMHPLTLLVNGMYGEELPNQNGAPLRLIVPWKYGFKSIKSIVRISLTDTQPPTSWNKAAPGEYGFYSNVNPRVDHPRWSQAEERVLGGGLFARTQPTLMFNGYEADVASLYAGMDLKANY